ncbi:hypothetical protein, partial [Sinorhizobium medicae]|uniref:hypothetical protein n=1 Tax=Sinorhizobium medicae TaxID=110321 RepID=UPI001AECE56D
EGRAYRSHGEIGYFSRSSHSQKINDLAFVQGQPGRRHNRSAAKSPAREHPGAKGALPLRPACLGGFEQVAQLRDWESQ